MDSDALHIRVCTGWPQRHYCVFFLAGGFMKGYFSKVGVSTAFSLPSGSYRGSRRQDTQSSAYHKFKFDENPVTDNR